LVANDCRHDYQANNEYKKGGELEDLGSDTGTYILEVDVINVTWEPGSDPRVPNVQPTRILVFCILLDVRLICKYSSMNALGAVELLKMT
jgi:hypothetical protein